MRRAIFLRLIFISTAAVLVFSVFLSFMLQFRYEKDLKQTLLSTLTAAVLSADRTQEPAQLAEKLSTACGGLRITVIQPDGTVTADTGSKTLPVENHYNRPEVIQARAAGKGYAKRFSATMGEDYLYVAVKSPDKNIYRAAEPVKGIENSVIQLLPVTIAGIVLVIFLSFLIAGKIASSVIKPVDKVSAEIMKIREGDYTLLLKDPEYEELAPLAASVNALVKSIVSALGTLEGEKEKLTFVLDNMKQGLVVVDSSLNILLCNDAARALFNNTGEFTGKPFLHLTHNPKIVEAVENSIKSGTTAIFNIQIDYFEKVYSVAVNHVSASWVENGAIVVLTDVTESSKLEQMRREFVANASHELKTPITSISGFAELLSTGMITDETQFNDYLGRIRDESVRITALLDDILKLSSLEGSKEMKKKERVDLVDAAQQAAKALAPQAETGGITVTVTGSSAVIMANPADIRHMITNLIENAIKYNKDGGAVTVTVSIVNENAQLTVTDTGIGIPVKDIPRIFERFYRVDKGRSRSVGGTGLGLSIVKHIVSSYAGDIQVKSTPGKGTEITVSFPLFTK